MRRGCCAHACLVVFLCLATAGLAQPTPPAPSEDAFPRSGAALDGDEIYRRVLRNRLRAYIQEATLISGDRGGSEQQYRLIATWKSFKSERSAAPGESTVLSKTLVRYTDPFDLRDTSYLILHHGDRPSDQFVYLPRFRRVRRVSLRSQPVFGTDFSFDDVVPDEFEDAAHRRLPDEPVGDEPCFVVELVPRPEAGSDYTKLWIYVEKRRYVPLRTRYWNLDGIEVKELNVDPASIREYDGVYIPHQASMRNLRSGSYTKVHIERITANPELDEMTFDLRRLIRH